MPKEKRSYIGDEIGQLFRPGDLIFGRHEVLQNVADYLKRRGYSSVKASDFNLPLIDELLTGRLTEKYIAGLDRRHQQHARLLLKHQDYLLANQGTNPWPEKPDKRRSIAFRRACKLIVREAAKTHSRSIHFMLGGMDHRQVAEKEAIRGRRDISISGGELRTAFRHREDVARPSSKKEKPAFLFYNEKNISVPPPWAYGQPDAKYYAGYQKALERKRSAIEDAEAVRAPKD